MITRKDFTEWLDKQPDEREFDYMDNSGCMICAFLKETGVKVYQVGGTSYSVTTEYGREEMEIPVWLADMAACDVPCEFTTAQAKAALAAVPHREGQ